MDNPTKQNKIKSVCYGNYCYLFSLIRYFIRIFHGYLFNACLLQPISHPPGNGATSRAAVGRLPTAPVPVAVDGRSTRAAGTPTWPSSSMTRSPAATGRPVRRCRPRRRCVAADADAGNARCRHKRSTKKCRRVAVAVAVAPRRRSRPTRPLTETSIGTFICSAHLV